MIQRRLYFLLALGITYGGFNVPTRANPPIIEPTEPFITEDNSVQALELNSIETIKLGYDALMKAGYAADQQRDYTTALRYFRQALTVRPDDSWANKAIDNITTYAFDRYMQAGYKADVNQDYQLALKFFQKALEIKPNSFHAQKAVANVSSYLAVNAQEPPKNTQDKNSSFFWISLGIVGTIGISAIALFFLLKKSRRLLRQIVPQPALTNGQNTDLESTVKENLSENTTTENIPDTRIGMNLSEAETLIAPPPKDTSKIVANSPPETANNQPGEIVTANTNISKLDIVPELIADLTKSERLSRQKTIWELAQRGDSRAMQPLVELMVKVDSQERGLILEAMTQITSRTLKPMNKALMMSLDDDNPRVKQNAIRDLARVYELMNQVTKRLSSVAEDSDEEVQKTAEWALKQLNQMPTVPFWQNHKMTENNSQENNNQDISN